MEAIAETTALPAVLYSNSNKANANIAATDNTSSELNAWEMDFDLFWGFLQVKVTLKEDSLYWETVLLSRAERYESNETHTHQSLCW